MSVTGEGGKGSARRKGANDQAYADNYDRIFSKVKCPECGSTDIELTWMEASQGLPEWQHGECEACSAEWNECARQAE